MNQHTNQPSTNLTRRGSRLAALLAMALLLQGCNGLSYVQRNDPDRLYNDFSPENAQNASVIGVGDPISTRQMKANSTISLDGGYDVEQVMQKISSTYNLAVRWGNGVRKDKRVQVMINQLTFDEARNYIEDVYDVQLIREGERRLLVLPSASEPRLASFNPGEDVSLSSAVKGLAEQCGYNLVLTENKQQLGQIHVTTHLKNVTCYDAFSALLSPHGLSIINTGDYYTIGGLPQRQWSVNLFEPVRSETQDVTLSTDSTATGGSSSGGSSSGSSSGGSSASQSASGSNKVTIKYDRNLWKDLEDDLNQLIISNCPASTDTPPANTLNPVGAPNTGASLLPPPSVAGRSGDSNLISDSSLKPVPVNQAVGSASSTPASSSSSSSSSGSSSASGTGIDTNRCGYVRINQAVGVVQMRAPMSVLEEANNIIQRVQDVASRRLLLEARVMAVTRERGYNQDGRAQIGNANNVRGSVNGFGFGGSITDALTGDLTAYTATNNGATYSAGGLAVKTPNLDVAVSLLERYGTTYTLMRPMMELMDRQRATLIDGTTERYYVIQSQSTTGTATTTSNSVDERTQFVGLQFSASAQIGEDGEPHTISLQIPITDQTGTVNIPNPNWNGSSSSGNQFSGAAPIINTRLIDQKVRIRDGEIKVIGGLTKTIAVDNESGVPVLRDILGLGKLFNSQNISYQNVEFVILLQVRRLNT